MKPNGKPYFKNLKCRECGRLYPKEAIHVCEFDFGPLEVVYDYQAIGGTLSHSLIESRPHSMWRYKELLPIEGEPTVGIQVGFTPLIRAVRLAEFLGVKELWIKNDSVNYPTLSFKDRVVSVALSRAKELGFQVIACASTGNLANSVAAHAAAAGMQSYVFIPHNLERGKVLASLVYGTQVVGIRGSYDLVNRLCLEIVGKYGWGFVNVNLRPYYAEGSKTIGFEILEQLGWRIPDHTVVCMASGSLLTKVYKAYQEAALVGLVKEAPFSIHGAQATGCSPISTAFRQNTDTVRPVAHPQTIAKSLAIGTPADGYYAIHAMWKTRGGCEDVTDEEIVQGIQFLAEYEGIFAEPAGGVTIACTKKLIENGSIFRNSTIVLCITGNGLKTQEALDGKSKTFHVIDPSISAFDNCFMSG
ncbi:Threonine synthase [Candidatus Xiphinematobacter sp. Idaho Grape]|uniref:threonine synthase n=1 Tax=Candidatus Xiphinematobacter sp. Idaho Grape TaxID=1704307 RepID=UPI000705ACFB|nr:threonine synthase [Candidatus Xiphinematobacter sp. Idaho Grape]ALJ56593.1 Threonine synthase [Candidatus Xiphinematobacter sp. Idaho Grape]